MSCVLNKVDGIFPCDNCGRCSATISKHDDKYVCTNCTWYITRRYPDKCEMTLCLNDVYRSAKCEKCTRSLCKSHKAKFGLCLTCYMPK